MSYFIIIRGSLGIGKTTIAKELEKELNAEYISIDKILEENNLDRDDNNFTAGDFVKANEIMIPKVRELLTNKKIVILDGCFYFREQIDHLEKKLKFKHFIFTLKAPVETCIKRDSKRKRVYGEQAAREVHQMVSKFDEGIIIDAENKSVKEIVEEITQKIKCA